MVDPGLLLALSVTVVNILTPRTFQHFATERKKKRQSYSKEIRNFATKEPITYEGPLAKQKSHRSVRYFDFST